MWFFLLIVIVAIGFFVWKKDYDKKKYQEYLLIVTKGNKEKTA